MTRRWMHSALLALLTHAAAFGSGNTAPQTAQAGLAAGPQGGRTIVAQVVALDAPVVYNRFGSFNPFSMVYALQGDVTRVPADTSWNVSGGQQVWSRRTGELSCRGYGWRYRDDVRPRPLVLRGNVGDTLEVHFQNRLMKVAPTLSGNCAGRGPYSQLLTQQGEAAEVAQPTADWPRTRNANLFIPGVTVLGARTHPQATAGYRARMERVCRGLESLAPGEDVVCRFSLERPGTHLFSSTGAPSGGQGDGGSLVHGLFGALHVERRGSQYYRSQVTAAELHAAWLPKAGGGRAPLNYAKLNLLRPLGGQRYEVVHGDLHAVIWEPPPTPDEIHVSVKDIADYRQAHPAATDADIRRELTRRALDYAMTVYENNPAYREFTAIFHDELKTFYPDAFRELGANPQLTGVKDGFALNYGASGMGSILLANRLGIGPSRRCVECLYEEFFLQSWANGDPALLERYAQDPSNVFHSYLNDRVAFRNLHAGPKETHVFHLHAHQWLSATDEDRGSYLDSQTIAPMQGHSYGIYAGGLKIFGQGQHEQTRGGGNRNRTVGDSIFHCHLYPHFAQGMWALWRTHDTLEDGTRTLPDGQRATGLSIQAESAAARPRLGTDPVSGANRGGTPVPAVVPVPTQALPPAPSYGSKGMPGYPFYIPGEAGHRAPQPPLDLANDAGLGRHVVLSGQREAHQGHGVYSQAAPNADAAAGHDHAAHAAHASPGKQVQRALALADFTAELKDLNLKFLPLGGTDLERRAMQFHAGEFGRSPLPGGGYGVLQNAQTGRPEAPSTSAYSDSYPSTTPEGQPKVFTVNGAPAQPGAPYADPCGAPRRYDPVTRTFKAYRYDPAMIGKRRYDVSAIQLNLVVNKDGWHDPQGRINVLSGQPNSRPGQPNYFSNARQKEGRASATEEPFFFRAQSGECITFYHSNRIPKDLERDDFQMRTPTDTIGQHIHLVKFDVTSSDGSGNGWNYEDGTLAPDAVLERKCAYNEYLYRHYRRTYFKDQSVQAYCGQPGPDPSRHFVRAFPLFGTPAFASLPVQTTVQRWFADPIVTVGLVPAPPDPGAMPGMRHPIPENIQKDRTLRTVFTHDHFAPSSIQQHGFYSALLIMPPLKPGTEAASWQNPDGSPLADAQGQAVGARAIVRNAVRTNYALRDGQWYATLDGARADATHRDHREFALAVADFALLYEPRKYAQQRPDFRSLAAAEASLGRLHGLDRLLAEAQLARANPDYYVQLRRKGVIASSSHLTGPQVRSLLSGADVQDLAADLRHWREKIGGRPVDPPQRPEAISTAHHNPFLVNYRQEPMPLRLGNNVNDPGVTRCGQTFVDNAAVNRPYFSAGRVRFDNRGSVNAQRPGAAGDPARVFLTAVHGDPCTPILEAFEGELVQFRLIQGAQEVQHVFTVEGLTWERLPDYEVYGAADSTLNMPDGQAARGQGQWPYPYQPRWVRDNPLGKVNSQEIGISEHFEAVMPYLANIEDAPRTVDHLYHFGTQDALWNGAWGLIRVSNGLDTVDTQACTNAKLKLGCSTLAQTKRLQPVNPASQGQVSLGLDAVKAVYPDTVTRYTLPGAAAPLTQDQFARYYQGNCPYDGQQRTPIRRFAAVATRVNLVRPGSQPRGLVYQPTTAGVNGLADPDGLIILPLPAAFLPNLNAEAGAYTTTYAQVMAYLTSTYGPPGKTLEPFVLRANAGDCVDLYVYNALKAPGEARPGSLPDAPGDALMPKIVPLNVDTDPHDPAQRDLRPSALLNLHVPQVAISTRYLQGVLNAGINPSPEQDGADLYATPPQGQNAPLSAHRLLFYAGEVSLEPQGASFTLKARPYTYGPLPLRAYSDVIGQGSHGLFGVVVIEPHGAQVMSLNPQHPASGAQPVALTDWHMQGLNAFICTADAPACGRAGGTRLANGFNEFILAYQDGLNLHFNGQPVPDCFVCDDSYDLGDRGFNYRSAPYWARLIKGNPSLSTELRANTNLNRAWFPRNFFTPQYASIPTRTFTALEGQDVRIRVLQVDGRARQHAFVTSGYGYASLLPNYGASSSALVAPGMAFTAQVQRDLNGRGGVLPGCTLYRDGPQMFAAAGMWGLLDVRRQADPGVSSCQ